MNDAENGPIDRHARSLTRMATWGISAAFALALTVVAIGSPEGSKRAALALAVLTGTGEAPQAAAVVQAASRSVDNEVETRRLNEAIRLLAADRDRLLTRVSSLEHNLDSVTGSIAAQASRASAAPQPEASAAPPPAIEQPSTVASAPASPPAIGGPVWISSGITTWTPQPAASLPTHRTAAVEPSAAATEARPAVTRTEFGIDLGSAATVAAAKEIWLAVKAQHGPLIGKLQPAVSNRANRAGVKEMRVIIGPLANAAAAAKLCAALGAADVMCSATTFSGERLAIR
jgi:hypothetical protein